MYYTSFCVCIRSMFIISIAIPTNIFIAYIICKKITLWINIFIKFEYRNSLKEMYFSNEKKMLHIQKVLKSSF